MNDYKIEVFMTPDEEIITTPYCWCVLERGATGWHNCGHGWAVTPKEAWEQAYEHYFNITTI